MAQFWSNLKDTSALNSYVCNTSHELHTHCSLFLWFGFNLVSTYSPFILPVKFNGTISIRRLPQWQRSNTEEFDWTKPVSILYGHSRILHGECLPLWRRGSCAISARHTSSDCILPSVIKCNVDDVLTTSRKICLLHVHSLVQYWNPSLIENREAKSRNGMYES